MVSIEEDHLDSNLNPIQRKNHANVGNGKGVYVNTALIDFYGKFGEFERAEIVFKSISNDQRDSGILNAMINILMDNDQNQKALELYKENESLLLAIKYRKYRTLFLEFETYIN